jgi:hypothetical protein
MITPYICSLWRSLKCMWSAAKLISVTRFLVANILLKVLCARYRQTNDMSVFSKTTVRNRGRTFDWLRRPLPEWPVTSAAKSDGHEMASCRVSKVGCDVFSNTKLILSNYMKL